MSTTRISKRLSWLLRHGAGEEGLPMDPAGWVAVADVLSHLRLSRAQLEEAVRTNDKRRLELDGERVRACQGHSTSTMPIEVEALEASWAEWRGTDLLWHGTSRHAIEGIATAGLRPQKRTHVHLTSSLESDVGKRAQVDLVLGVDPSAVRGHGLRIYEAPNGVVLTRRVPRSALVELRAITRKARAREAELLARLGL